MRDGSTATAVGTRGRLRLKPVDESLDERTLVVEISVGRSDGVLTFGDLRLAAEEFETYGRFEEAHRLWLALALAGTDQAAEGRLIEQALERAALALARAGEELTESFRRSGVKFDYVEIALDRSSGMSAAETAEKHGCSVRTVARASDYVAQRDALLERYPMFFDQLGSDADPVGLAEFHGVEPKVMRWMLALQRDRRA